MAKTFKKLVYEISFIGARISWKKVTNPTLSKKRKRERFHNKLKQSAIEVFCPIFGISTSRTLLLLHFDSTNNMFPI
jgi:hypothetical protein